MRVDVARFLEYQILVMGVTISLGLHKPSLA